VFGVGEHDDCPITRCSSFRKAWTWIIEELARLQPHGGQCRLAKADDCRDDAAARAVRRGHRAVAHDRRIPCRLGEVDLTQRQPSVQTDLTTDAARAAAAVRLLQAARLLQKSPAALPGVGPRLDSSSGSSFMLGKPRQLRRKQGRQERYWHSVARVGLQSRRGAGICPRPRAIVHRDIKAVEPAAGHARHGLGRRLRVAKAVPRPAETEENLTELGDILGPCVTCRPRPLTANDARGDIYSLGLTLYRACCGTAGVRGARSQQADQAGHDGGSRNGWTGCVPRRRATWSPSFTRP